MEKRTFQPVELFSGQAVDGWSRTFNAGDYLWLQIAVSTSGSADGDILVAGSHLDADSVDFTSAAAVGNEWGYIAMFNEASPDTTIAGATGAQYTGTDGVRYLYVNTSTRKTLAVQLANYVAGAFHVTVTGTSNQ